jgi:hypothetical protein
VPAAEEPLDLFFILATNRACQFVGIFVGIDHN